MRKPHYDQAEDTFVLPFVYGSSAFWLGKQSEEEHSHRWMVYVRGYEFEDLSYAIKSVTFTLHQSFAEPVRVLTKPPYVVEETGWGEFSIKMAIAFHHCNATETTVLTHHLRLFPENRGAQSMRKPVVAEHYDEIMFTSPPEPLRRALMQGPTQKVETDLNAYLTQTSFQEQEIKALKELQMAQDKIDKKTSDLRQRLFDAERGISNMGGD